MIKEKKKESVQEKKKKEMPMWDETRGKPLIPDISKVNFNKLSGNSNSYNVL